MMHSSVIVVVVVSAGTGTATGIGRERGGRGKLVQTDVCGRDEIHIHTCDPVVIIVQL